MKAILQKLLLNLLVPSLVGLSSCTKDFLQEENKTGITADVLYNTPEGMENLINSCYAPTRLWYGKMIGYLLTEAGTDEMLRAGWGGGYSPYHEYTSSLQGSDPGLIHVWGGFYKGINACNAAIGRLGGSALAANVKTLREGEARFLRAFYYYHLVETFGAVPIRTKETESPEMTAERAPAEEVYKLIFSDLEIALKNLAGVVTPQGGRVTQPAVEAFLARLYLTRKMYPQALDMAKRVINNYDFKLQPDYKALWNMANSNGNTNKESVWFVNYTANNELNDRPRGSDLGFFYLWEGGHNAHAFFTMMNFGLPGFTWDLENGRPLNQFLPSRYLLDLYDETKDARYAGTFRTAWWANDAATLPAGVKLGDTIFVASKNVVPESARQAKKYTIMDRNDVYDAAGVPKGDRSRYVQLNKFADPTRPDKGVHESKRDAFVFRLSEMYLIAAEASMELSDKGAAADFINVVRSRAALPGKEQDMRIAAAAVNLDFILDERARELAGEQVRWFDLKRTGKMKERLAKGNPEASANFKDFHLVRPIPQVEIDVMQNKEAFKQNQGYN
ncbi:RagB/SusD family nutrient uptake outer membrane protein [Paraflavisolibacter sp. H34]|uniref:RagB/SusD family nutrient uptake outer membrane protein n=1 Tax=Huijunlia imazamoxiresistens TaxID=3127457 RepID=UPI00301B324D